MKKQPRSLRRTVRAVAIAAGLLAIPLSACISVESDRGVEATWREVSADAFVRGETTRAQVLEALGPPSQVVALEDETAFYYLLEKTRGKGLILLVYNDRRERTSYDRAVYFFDESGVLSDYALGE
jgi:outer membrane protein assembly factor BamE (lipoprotein component of BamABCDE complex)